jgi:hypothetical protein
MNDTAHSAKRIILALLCLSLVNVLCSQSTFQKGYSTLHDCKLVVSQETADGNIIAAGTAFPGSIILPVLPGIRERMCLIKTDMNGDTLWTKTYGGTDNYRCSAMQQTLDNGFILGGRVVDSIIGDSKIILIKTDANGNMTWSHTYNSLDYNEEIFAIRETVSGDYIMAGNGFVGRVSATGTLIWAKDLKTSNVNLRLRSLDHTDDGSMILGGTMDTVGSVSYAYLIKMGSSGNVIWSKAYHSIHKRGEECNSVSQATDKGFILTGITYYPVGPGTAVNCIYLAKTDSVGNLLWSKKFASGANDTGYDVKQTTDGGYVVTGTSSGFIGNSLVTNNAFLIKTNAVGHVTWCNYYGVILNSYEVPASVSLVNDGGYLVSGTTTDNMGHPHELYLLKTDMSGNVDCNGYNWPMFDSTYVSFAFATTQPITTMTLAAATAALNQNHLLCAIHDACNTATDLKGVERADAQFRIYPNPANDRLIIDVISLSEKAQVRIYNALGELMLTDGLLAYETSVDIHHLQKGIYFLSIIAGENTITEKIVKE